MGMIRPIRRTLRPAGKYLQAAARWRRLHFDEAPPMFGNAKPKSGSHLLLQVLAGFTQVMPYAYVQADPIRTITKDGRRREQAEVSADLQRVPRGVIGWGYVDPTPENISILCRPDRVTFFIFRDPRDMLVSQVFFATDIYEEHGMHAYYNSLPDFDARLKAAIGGVDREGLKMVDVRQRYEGVLRWLSQQNMLCLRYEALVNSREATLGSMLDRVQQTGYVIPKPRAEALSILSRAIQPGRSHTFRSGKTGGWKQYFTDEHKQLFRKVAGDLLVRLGYEDSERW
jgi:hypothetical protein